LKPFIVSATNASDYLIKTTQGLTLVSLGIITPFGFYNIFQGRYALSVLAFVTSAICVAYLWSCLQGRCNRNYVTFTIVPLIVVSIPSIFLELGVVGAYWSIPAVLSLYFLLSEKKAWVANMLFLGAITPVAWSTLELSSAVRFLTALVGASLYAAITVRVITTQQRVLSERAVRDPLTGLYNRSFLQDALEHAIDQNRRTGTDMSLLMIDVDHFKHINDDFGHDAGDSVLRDFGDFLKHYFRGSDNVFRIGGEEFLVLVYNTGEHDATGIAEELRKSIECLPLLDDRTISISVGVAGLKPDMDWRRWMKQCDDNLYRAKAGGRNLVVA